MNPFEFAETLVLMIYSNRTQLSRHLALKF